MGHGADQFRYDRTRIVDQRNGDRGYGRQYECILGHRLAAPHFMGGFAQPHVKNHHTLYHIVTPDNSYEIAVKIR